MKRIIKIITSLFLLILIFLCNFNKTQVFCLDLLTAVEKAKKADPRFSSVFHEYRAVLTLPKQSRASLLPQVSTAYSRVKINYYSAPANYFDYYSYNFRISLQQPILNLPAWVDYSQSKIKTYMAESKLNDEELNLIKRVTDAYFDLLYAIDYLKVLQEEKKAIFEQLQMVKKLFSAGEATLTDVNDAEARYSDVLFRIVSAEKNLYSAKNNLARLIGETPEDLMVLSEEVEFKEVEPSKVEDWVEFAKKRSPIIKYYLQAKEIAEKEISKQTFTAFPRIDFIAYYTKSTAIEYLRTAPITYSLIGIQISIPLFTGGYISAKKEEAREKFLQAKKDFERAVSDVTQQVVDYFFATKSAYAQIYAGVTALNASKLALDSTKKGYKAGIRTIVDVLNAESNYYQAKLNLLKAKYEYIKNLIALKYTCGILSYEDIIEVNNWLK